LRFPEQFAEMRELDADVVVVPAAWPAVRIDHWRVLLQARAIDTQTPMVGCNATGLWDDVQVGGSSMVVDGRGRVSADAGTEPGWLRGRLDNADTAAWRADFPLR
jgi:predicted amidohydrolase